MKIARLNGAIALSYNIVIDDSSWKNAAESFAVALTLTLGGYESAIAPYIHESNHSKITTRGVLIKIKKL